MKGLKPQSYMKGGVNFFILDSRRIFHPAPSVLGRRTHLKSRCYNMWCTGLHISEGCVFLVTGALVFGGIALGCGKGLLVTPHEMCRHRAWLTSPTRLTLRVPKNMLYPPEIVGAMAVRGSSVENARMPPLICRRKPSKGRLCVGGREGD